MNGTMGRIVLIAVVAVAAAAWLPSVVTSRETPKPRDIRIVVKDMAFYANGGALPNPTLTFKAGEEIRLVLRNEDGGMTHDFSVKAWQVGTKTLSAKGEEDVIVFRVPDSRGTIAYQCTPHSEMMRGTIQVE